MDDPLCSTIEVVLLLEDVPMPVALHYLTFCEDLMVSWVVSLWAMHAYICISQAASE